MNSMKPLTLRQIDILDTARQESRVDVDDLASRFEVTPQTIRKDLNELCRVEKLYRVHGGAIFPANTHNLAYQARRKIAFEAKSSIAKAASELIPDNSSLILNIGTTTEQVALALLKHQGLVVITNNLNVAMTLTEAPDIDVVIAGGMIRKTDGGLVDVAAIEVIKQFKVDYAVIGSSAIDNEGCLLDFDHREVRVTQAILEHARKVILVADSKKFERRAPVAIAHLKDIDVFITDVQPSVEITAICSENGVLLIIADETNLY